MLEKMKKNMSLMYRLDIFDSQNPHTGVAFPSQYVKLYCNYMGYNAEMKTLVLFRNECTSKDWKSKQKKILNYWLKYHVKMTD